MEHHLLREIAQYRFTVNKYTYFQNVGIGKFQEISTPFFFTKRVQQNSLYGQRNSTTADVKTLFHLHTIKKR